MSEFHLTLRNEKVIPYRKSLWVLVGLNAVFLLLYGILTGGKGWVLTGLTAVLTGLGLLYARAAKGRDAKAEPGVIILGFYMGLYLYQGYWWVSLGLLLIILLYTMAVQVRVLHVSAEGLRLEGFPSQKIAWQELNNLVLRDGLLTIDFRSNRLMQQEVDGGVEEQAFNAFCEGRLNNN